MASPSAEKSPESDTETPIFTGLPEGALAALVAGALPLAAVEGAVLVLPLAALDAVVLVLAEPDGVVALLLEELQAATPRSTTIGTAIPAKVCRLRPPAPLPTLFELGSFTLNNLQLIEPGHAGNAGQQSFAES